MIAAPRRDAEAGNAPNRDAEAGNAALELAILGPVLLFLIGLVIAFGRVSNAQNAVAAAARDAARQASLQLDPGAAVAAGQQSALAALARDGLHCAPSVNVDVTGFQAAVGQPASVSASVTCVVSLASITVPGLPGSTSLSATFTSPLDPYRER